MKGEIFAELTMKNVTRGNELTSTDMGSNWMLELHGSLRGKGPFRYRKASKFEVMVYVSVSLNCV